MNIRGIKIKRKIIKQGHSTHTITLPAKWISKYKLNAGDEVEVEEKYNNLVIRTGKDISEEKVKIKVSGPSKLIRRYIGNLYRKGYDEVELCFDDPSLLNEIQSHVEPMLGYEIIHQGKNCCTIKNVATALDTEFHNMFRRMFLITLSLADESYEAVRSEEYSRLGSISMLEATQNKLYNFCSRTINKSGHKMFATNTFIYLLIHRLEQIGDSYRDICLYLGDSSSKKIKLGKDTLELYKSLNEMLRNLYEFYYKFDEEKAVYFSEKKKELCSRSHDLFKTCKGDELVVVHHLWELTIKIYEAASPTFSIAH